MTDNWLNTENIQRSEGGVEYHPLKPFLPEQLLALVEQYRRKNQYF